MGKPIMRSNYRLLIIPDVQGDDTQPVTPRIRPSYLNSSSWLPVRSKNATESSDDQITSQSPEFAT